MNPIKPTRIYPKDEFKRSVSATSYIFSVSPLIAEDENCTEYFCQIEEELFQINYSKSPSRPASPTLEEKKLTVVTE